MTMNFGGGEVHLAMAENLLVYRLLTAVAFHFFASGVGFIVNHGGGEDGFGGGLSDRCHGY